MTKPIYNRFYLPQLDGLRFIAFALVFIHHLRPAPGSGLDAADSVLAFLHDFGWMGVELFFVISAFLMTSLMLREHEAKGRIDVGKFYTRRILRIWPLYLFAIALGTLAWPAVFYGFGSAEHVGILRSLLLPYMLFAGNIATAVLGYPSSPPLALLWSISAEEQFYLILPLLMTLLAPTRLSTIARVLIGIFLFGLGVRCALLLNGAPHPAAWVLPVARPESFLAGMLIAVANERLNLSRLLTARSSSLLLALAVAALVVVGQFPNLNQASWHSMWQYTLVSLSFGAVVAVFIGQGIPALTRVFASSLIVSLGKISYGLYIYHTMALVVTRKLVNTAVGPDPTSMVLWAAEGAFALVATIIAAVVSYQVMERPFLRLKARFEIVKSRPVELEPLSQRDPAPLAQNP